MAGKRQGKAGRTPAEVFREPRETSPEPAAPAPHSFQFVSRELIVETNTEVMTYCLDIPHSGCVLRFVHLLPDGREQINDTFVPNLSLRDGKLVRSIV